MKICSKCKNIKDLGSFYKRKTQKDGCRSQCKSCEKAYNNTEVRKETVNNFNAKNKEYRDNYYIENCEEIKTKVSVYRSENNELVNLRGRAYKKANPGKVNFSNSKRIADKLQATLKLSQFDQDYIKYLYIQAKELEKLDGIKYHVDHIVPLRGKTVCGLHVPWNLQVITAEENMKKHNKFLGDI